ncbi:hypothetical protein CR513_34101, partial [Mucuna pruriens]
MERKGGCDHQVRRILERPPHGYLGSHQLQSRINTYTGRVPHGLASVRRSYYALCYPRLRSAKRRVLKENLACLEKHCQKRTQMGTAELWGLIQLQFLAPTQNKMHPFDLQTLDRSRDPGKIPERAGVGPSSGRERRANDDLARLRVKGSGSPKPTLPTPRADNPAISGRG